MDKLSDAELSLAVATIIGVNYIAHTQLCRATMEQGLDCECGGVVVFDYTTDDAGMKMCVWLAKNSPHWGDVHYLLAKKDNPHRAIAEAILDTV